MPKKHYLVHMETWKQIKNWPMYEVSDLGRIRSNWEYWGFKKMPVPHLLKPSDNGWALQVNLCDGKNRKLLAIHRLVLETFVELRPNGMECRHLDGDYCNNRLENLRWGTPQENHQDSIRHGTFKHGEESAVAILTRKDVHQIWNLRRKGLSRQKIARKLNKNESTVRSVLRGQSWKRITLALIGKNNFEKLKMR